MKARKLFATAVAGAAALAMSLVGVSAATAAPTLPQVGGIDTTETGTLTIHKYAGVGDEELDNDGNEVEVTDRAPVAGVTFTIDQIGLNLANSASWTMLSALTPDGAKDLLLANTTTTEVTDAQGVATFEDLAVGAYLVRETAQPGFVKQPSQPFIVTVPMPNGEDGWNYDVHAYPKNQVNTTDPTKAVDDAAALKAGDKVTYTITANNIKADGTKFDSYVVTDKLVDLAYVADSSKVVLNTETPQTLATKAVLTAATETEPATLTFTLNDADLAKVNAAALGTTLTFTFNATVTAAGKIANTATVNGTATNQVFTNWGQIKITKTDADNNDLLAGAVFDVYTAATNLTDETEDTPLYTVTTDKNGTVTTGLLKAGDYKVVEKTAPAGYVKDTTVHEVTVEAGDAAAASVVGLTVENSKVVVPGLPITGSQAKVLMIGAGVLLLLGASAVAIRRRNA